MNVQTQNNLWSRVSLLLFVFVAGHAWTCSAVAQLKIATFEVDASPPIGSPLAYDPTTEIQTPLSCRGIVLLSEQAPIVLCSIDWLGVANNSQIEFKRAFAKAANTSESRVSIHAVHQHDAPRCDFSAEEILAQHGYAGQHYDVQFCRKVIDKAAVAIGESVKSAMKVSHLGIGEGEVEKVASNRRIIGTNGKILATRYTATRDAKIRAYPIGTIDPMLKSISFWNDDQCLAVLTFYATHPQSYYRTGKANPDFPGLARDSRQKDTGVPHIHFNGAGGNIGAGKWNDGAKEYRKILANRVAQGMEKAWINTKRVPINPDSVSWTPTEVQLPIGKTLKAADQLQVLKNKKESPSNHLYAAKHLAWIRRTESKRGVPMACLRLNNSKIMFVPGELFVEYQLAAQEMAGDSFVAMAAYGEYGMGYIGTAVSYSQGGYESSPRASRVDRGSEAILLNAFRKLLK